MNEDQLFVVRFDDEDKVYGTPLFFPIVDKPMIRCPECGGETVQTVRGACCLCDSHKNY